MATNLKFFRVLDEGELAEGEGRVVFAGIKRIALFLIDGEYLGLQNHCPHAGGHLGLGPISGCIVRCPRHAWGFDIKTGECITNPRYSAKTYPTRVEDGGIWIGVPDDGNIV